MQSIAKRAVLTKRFKRTWRFQVLAEAHTRNAVVNRKIRRLLSTSARMFGLGVIADNYNTNGKILDSDHGDYLRHS